MQTWRLLLRPRMVAIIGPPDKINYTISQQVVSNPYVQQPNSSNIIKIIQFVAYRYVVTISSIGRFFGIRFVADGTFWIFIHP